ncbi:Na+/H+ antiporter NhaA [Chelatococcus sp. SYSU_G07232]|uniref:Na(+)/H(+) antiporter NhaA n=1 Tax=Chelatococcus albus TaxID=3047466 RepID=A0ABT7ADE2_9HYPH|nr:Na+/H+ antiporter NhaA [Chelatococcus sp. SYSU_G07232]MDJ1157394.1 Na+/H+ antiporter NhaA [Chelatococcus sp. SYSU_G07232]
MQKQGVNQDIVGGFLLAVAALIAILIANSPLSGFYDQLLSTKLNLTIDPAGTDAVYGLSKPLVLWINDGLMAVFFFTVGMEIKREFVEGSLAGARRAAMPAIAALGGVVLPALIYWAVARNDAAALAGWAIPTATDIAFVVAVCALLGNAVPPALKAFLLALAIIDDLVAIVVIAVFYTAELSTLSLGLAGLGVAALVALNLLGVRSLALYILVGLYTWVCVLKSGVHATLAGVALGLAVPLERDATGRSLNEDCEHALKPWVAHGILPLFAFANAGVGLSGLSADIVLSAMPLGIALGLFIGKQLGVFGFALVAAKLRLAELPPGITPARLYGGAILTGIGFTMSLFIGTLAYDDPAPLAMVRLGVIAGSVLSVVTGTAVLLAVGRREREAVLA